MVLTQLEADLLSNLARSGRPVGDLLRFVELHSDREADVSAPSALQALLDRWAARGWLATGEPPEAGARDVLVANWRVLRPRGLTVGPESGDVVLWLTDAARCDVEWLPLPPHGPLQPTTRAMAYFEDTLRDVVQGRIPVAEAQRVLRERASFSFGTNPQYVHWHQPLPAGTDIRITVADVRRALARYLDGEWADDELRGWAEFITLVDAFSAPEPPPQDEDYYDDLWDVVHDLGRPEVFGEITRASVEAKLARLARYSSEPAPRAT
jgi:hypothetical protein